MNEKVEVDGNVDSNMEQTLLLVKGFSDSKEDAKEYVKKLANAILSVHSKYNIAHLRCVGAAAINNTIKAFIIAKGEADKAGRRLFIEPSFTSVSFDDGESKTAILFEVKQLK